MFIKNLKNYSDDILNYIIYAQKNLSKWIFIFFISYGALSYIINLNFKVSIIQNKLGYYLECITSLLGYYLFGVYLKKNKKYSFIIAYLNIFFILLFLEFQYFTSYNLLICIIMASAVTIIGPSYYYFSTIDIILIIDTFLTIFNYGGTIPSIQILNYIIDNLLVLSFSTGINMYFTKIKYTDIILKNKLTFLSETDSLTKLLNRKAAKDFITKCSNKLTPSAMFIIDLDNFKLVNDIFGHMQGDFLLCEVAFKFKKLFKNTKCISRLGGDEFMIFLPEFKDKEYIIHKAKEIINLFPIYVCHENKKIEVTCSIGIAISKEYDENLYENLYKEADLAMYKAKNLGKNQFVI